MAEKKGVGHAYNVDFLNVVFAASSVFLFLSVVWMVWDDYDRDWKNTQRRFAELEYQVTQAQLQQATRGVDRNKLQQLQAQLQAAREERRGQPAEGRRAAGASSRRPTTGCTARRSTTRPEGDLRPGPLRLRGVARANGSSSGREAAGSEPS